MAKLTPYQKERRRELLHKYPGKRRGLMVLSKRLMLDCCEAASDSVQVSQDMVQHALDAFPQLTILGTAIPKTREEEEQLRQQLLNAVDRIQATVEWLQRIEKGVHINTNYDSYGLKQIARSDIGYIQNGIFICAAYLAGFKVQTYHDEPNTTFNMTTKSIKAARRRAGDL